MRSQVMVAGSAASAEAVWKTRPAPVAAYSVDPSPGANASAETERPAFVSPQRVSVRRVVAPVVVPIGTRSPQIGLPVNGRSPVYSLQRDVIVPWGPPLSSVRHTDSAP
jgi:hypothetical protein